MPKHNFQGFDWESHFCSLRQWPEGDNRERGGGHPDFRRRNGHYIREYEGGH
jgi:hypothetical protein